MSHDVLTDGLEADWEQTHDFVARVTKLEELVTSRFMTKKRS